MTQRCKYLSMNYKGKSKGGKPLYFVLYTKIVLLLPNKDGAREDIMSPVSLRSKKLILSAVVDKIWLKNSLG